MRVLAPLLAAAAVLALPSPGAPAGEEVPACSFDRVDHSRPEAHLALSPRFGSEERIRALAKTLRGGTDEETLANVHAWMGKELRYDAAAFDRWRDFAAMAKDGTYGGCADYALLFGSLSRAAGIPTVWVKTMDAAWIRDFLAGRPEHRTWRGHVFLEVHVGGRWRLLEPGGLSLYDEYETTQRVLPGERWAYDKGDDPWGLVLSVRWKEWLVQTERHFKGFDPSVLPVTGPRRLFRSSYEVVILAGSEGWKAVSDRCAELGFPRSEVFSTNSDFADWVRRAKGKHLVVTCIGEEPVLPPEMRAAILPVSMEEFRKVRAGKPSGVLRKRLPDGTRVALLYAPDAASFRAAAAGLTLEK